MSDDDRTRIDALLATLGVDCDTPGGDPDATLRHDALLQGTGPTLSASTLPPPPDAVSELAREAQRAIQLLPNISLHGPADATPPSQSAHAAAASVVAAAAATGTAAHAPADLRVVRVLGEGGMGTVYLAHQHSIGRDVAVKRVRADLTATEHALSLLREARTTGSLEHPNIVPVHALGRGDDGAPVLVMKRVEGTVWRALLEHDDHPAWAMLPFSRGDRLGAHLEVLMHVCNALRFAHARGVFHRDLKPENVMIGEFGEVYLLDWGIALQRGTGVAPAPESKPGLVGTPAYMAPEMLSGDPSDVDERTDVYLLGATLHEVLTRRSRHAGRTLYEALHAAAASEPCAHGPEEPAELVALCRRATARDRRERPANATDFRNALADFLKHRASLALSASADASLERARSSAHTGASSDARSGSNAASGSWRLLSEARFGYMQALREWPENPRARAGLRACLEALVDRELAQRNVAGVRVLFDEMGDVGSALRTRLDDLERELADERERLAAAEREKREMDSSVSVRARLWVMLAVLGITFGISVPMALREYGSAPTPMRDVVRMDAVLVTVLLAGVGLARRKLFANRISRQLSLMGVLTITLSAVSDGFVWLRGGDSREAALHSLLVMGTGFAVGASMAMPKLWIASVILFSAGFVAALRPAMGAVVGIAALMLACAVVVWLMLEDAKERSRRDGTT